MITPAAAAQSEAPEDGTAVASNALRPGDAVRLRIWREPDLSGEFVVNREGVVVFPKIGEVEVTGASPESLKADLLEAYRHYLRNPSISVRFLRRVTIIGAVRAPGLYPIDPTMTVANALALAGGAMPHGEPDEVKLFRDGRELTTNVTQQTRVNDLPIRSGDQLFVPERSWVSRNTGILTTMISSGVSLLIAVVSITMR